MSKHSTRAIPTWPIRLLLLLAFAVGGLGTASAVGPNQQSRDRQMQRDVRGAEKVLPQLQQLRGMPDHVYG